MRLAVGRAPRRERARHQRDPPRQPCGPRDSIRFTIADAHVRICVRDRIRSGSIPAALTSDEQRGNGRGLQIVSRLAEWSERVIDGRREVSAELSL